MYSRGSRASISPGALHMYNWYNLLQNISPKKRTVAWHVLWQTRSPAKHLKSPRNIRILPRNTEPLCVPVAYLRSKQSSPVHISVEFHRYWCWYDAWCIQSKHDMAYAGVLVCLCVHVCMYISVYIILRLMHPERVWCGPCMYGSLLMCACVFVFLYVCNASRASMMWPMQVC